MPLDSILVATGVCIMFLLFALAVAWADHTTTQWLSKKAAVRQSADAEAPYRKVA